MAWYFNCEYFLQQTLKACKRWYQIYPITRIYIWCILCKKLTCWNRKGEWEMFHFVGKKLLWWHYLYKKKERRRTKIACLKVFTNVVNWGFEEHNKAGKETLVCASFTNCNDSIFSFRESPSDCNQGGAWPGPWSCAPPSSPASPPRPRPSPPSPTLAPNHTSFSSSSSFFFHPPPSWTRPSQGATHNRGWVWTLSWNQAPVPLFPRDGTWSQDQSHAMHLID